MEDLYKFLTKNMNDPMQKDHVLAVVKPGFENQANFVFNTNKYNKLNNDICLFLAGGITNCQNWQDHLIKMLNEENAEKIRNCMQTNFTQLYLLLEWKLKAWDLYKRYLIDGCLAFEIIYDNIETPRSIVGIVELDPATLTKKYEDVIKASEDFIKKLGLPYDFC